jgi:general secretion pathway protein L
LARWGLIATGLALIGGLNAAAWQTQAVQRQLQQQTRQTVQTAFPQIDLVLNASVQMRRELDRLQAGGHGGHSLEHLLQTLAPAIQAQARLTALDFDSQGARFTFDPQAEPDLTSLQIPLASAGWAAPQRSPEGWRLRPLPSAAPATPSP